jgi:hypothetical protein
MITFKQFLSEIDHNDEVYKKASSDWIAKQPLGDSWEPLLKLDDFDVMWKPYGKGFKVAAVEPGSKEVAVLLELKEKIASVPSGKLHGVVVDALSSQSKFRGQDLALKIYEALVEHGQVLFSSNSQTTGSRRLWEDLVNGNSGVPFVLAEDAAARWYKNKDDTYPTPAYPTVPNVLLTGPLEAMNDEAYASSETRWVMLPHDLNNLAEIKDKAIRVPQGKSK